MAKYTVTYRGMDGRIRRQFSSLEAVQKYVRDRWEGLDYYDRDYYDRADGFHNDYGTFTLTGCTLYDLGTRKGEWDWEWKNLAQPKPTPAPLPDPRVLRIAAELLPVIDDLTTSDLQGIVSAEVMKLGLMDDETWQLEEAVLKYIYSAQERA